MPTWVRVRDKDTRHEYDVNEEDPRLHAADSPFEVLEDYPENSSPTAIQRPPKHRVALPPAGPPEEQGSPPDNSEQSEEKPETTPQAGPTAKNTKE